MSQAKVVFSLLSILTSHFISASYCTAEPTSQEGLFVSNFSFYGPHSEYTIPDSKKNEYLSLLKKTLIEDRKKKEKFSGEALDIPFSNAHFLGGNNANWPKFRSPDGWEFKLTLGRQVLRVPLSPMTIEQTRRFQADIQTAIFDTAAKVDLLPSDEFGRGDLTFDTQIFNGDLFLARNFVVDFWNHNELAMGILGYNTEEALPIWLNSDTGIDSIRQILNQVDDGRYPNTSEGIALFFADLSKAQETSSDASGEKLTRGNYDLNFEERGKLRIQSIRAQKDVEQWIRQIELIENRIRYLRKIDKPVTFSPRVRVRPTQDRAPKASNTPPIDQNLAIDSFRQYVVESGLPWEIYRAYLPTSWDRLGNESCSSHLE